MEPSPHLTGDAGGTVLPVNIAPPKWQCPICSTTFGTDLDKATACAQAGPAPQVASGTPVLALTRTKALFGLTEVGPVRPEKVDDVLTHVQDVVVAGTAVSTKALQQAARAGDDLLVITSRTTRETAWDHTSASLSTYGVLAGLFMGGKKSWGQYSSKDITVWVEEGNSGTSLWVNAPDAAQRAVLNTVTGGLLDTITAADPEPLTAQIRSRYAEVSHRHSNTSLLQLLSPREGLMIADAHGAPNHVWANRWLAAHLDTVTTWQVTALRAWAAGAGGPIPMGWTLLVPEKLPRNPGKRRLEVMAPYGTEYRPVLEAVLAELTTDAPVNPVPGLGTVSDTVRPNPKEGPDHV